MKYITILVILLNFYVHAIKSSNILVFVPSPWKSHVIAFQPLFLELANRGHNVTVISKFTVKDPPPTYTHLIPSYNFDIDGSKLNLFAKMSYPSNTILQSEKSVIFCYF